jgi:hypothetical protein
MADRYLDARRGRCVSPCRRICGETLWLGRSGRRDGHRRRFRGRRCPGVHDPRHSGRGPASRSVWASSPPCSSRTFRRRSRHRPTSQQAAGVRDGLASSGCSWSSPSEWPRLSASWRPTSVVRCRAIALAALAAGGLLAMLTNSLIPFSFERGGALAGAATALGFCLSVLNS